MPIDLEPGRRVPIPWEEYLALGTGTRGEYIDGELVVSPLPPRRHQLVCRRLINVIEAALPPGVDVSGSWGWKPDTDEFGPDIIVFDSTDEDLRYTGTPYLCAEVLSTDRAADLVRKFAKYATAGLRRYWVIDPQVPEMMVFELSAGGGYREATRLVGSESATLDIGPVVVTVSPADLVG